MKELLEYILESILDTMDSVTIEETTEEDGTILFVINSDDELKGAIIGRKGRTIQSIRSILGVKAAKENVRVYVKVE